MPIILKQPDKVQVKNNDYIWDRDQRKLVKKENAAPAKEEYVSAKTETYWDPTIKQLVTKPEPPKSTVIKREVPFKEMKGYPSHYIKVEDGSLHKLYNTKSQYLKDMAALKSL